ncbi:rhamnulokinase family protein [Haloferula chungangensis]|uniref:Rhamnulokinase family protein n=1 Tax=Haloferula chungangensis TaxID=1048331 RepID=A0ABW2L1R5_9BACT
MSQKKVYLAVDLGAGSGRVLAGEFDGSRIELRELNRFENTPVELPDGWHWNITSLYQNILEGLKIAAKEYGDAAVSVGVDTWGVDYALIDKKGGMLGLPYQYRDSRTDEMMETAYAKVPKKEIYEATGIQFMFFNSIFQLLSEVEGGNGAIDQAEDILFMPDLVAYWLSGEKSQERSIVSTTQLYNPVKKDWDFDLIEKLGLPKHLFKKIKEPGTELGTLRPNVAELTGFKNLKVVTVAGHDTASAVAAVPSDAPVPAYISSGTWSLMGLELPEPVISDQSFDDAFTNEIGINNSVRFLKNICGLWLVQESRRFWLSKGEKYEFGELAALAGEAEPFRSLINPDDPRFSTAGRMPEKIQEFCRETGQAVPETPGEIVRCINESLAMRYAEVWDRLMTYTDQKPEVLHVVGGGCQDRLLNQFTANAIGVTVKAGPVEATGLGNILAQMLADGAISSLAEGREIVAASFEVEDFEHVDDEVWALAREKFAAITQSA